MVPSSIKKKSKKAFKKLQMTTPTSPNIRESVSGLFSPMSSKVGINMSSKLNSLSFSQERERNRSKEDEFRKERELILRNNSSLIRS